MGVVAVLFFTVPHSPCPEMFMKRCRPKSHFLFAQGIFERHAAVSNCHSDICNKKRR